MDVNGVYQVNNLDAWQGSFGTGAGFLPSNRGEKENQEEEAQRPNKPPKGVVKDESGVVHIDLIA